MGFSHRTAYRQKIKNFKNRNKDFLKCNSVINDGLRSLIREGIKTNDLSGIDAINRHIHMLCEFVLSNTNILASSLNAEELTNDRPEFIFPCDEVILYTVTLKLIIKKKKF